VPIIALSFLAFVFAPQSYTAAAPYVIASILGAACFSLVPVALEFVAEVTHPVGPEISSTLCWTGGQLGGGIAIVVMDALKAGNDADPPENMYRSLVFQAVWACLVVPVPLCLGLFGRAEEVKSRRVEEDVGNGGSGGGGVGETGRGRIEEEEEENGEEEREGNERDEGTSWLLQGQS
jgi:FLVCR family MFS transporter 7